MVPAVVILLVAVGGAAGAVSRYVAVALAARLWPGAGWPAGTLAVNLAGCLVIGLLHERLGGRPELRAAVVVGYLGALTTFSSYALEIVLLADARRWLAATAYLAASNVAGLALVAAGAGLARRFADAG